MKQRFRIEDGKVIDNCNLAEKHTKSVHSKNDLADEIELDLLDNELHGAVI